VVTLSDNTCPSSCPLKSKGCYAKGGPIAISWARVSRGEALGGGNGRWAGSGWADLSTTLVVLGRDKMPAGTLVRIGDAGDPSFNGRIPKVLVDALGSLRSMGHHSIVYTHAPETEHNHRMAHLARSYGVVINGSHHGTDVPEDDAHGYGRVTTVSRDTSWIPYDGGQWTEDHGIRRCPAEYTDQTCRTCLLCSKARGYAIGFTAHGASARAVEAVS